VQEAKIHSLTTVLRSAQFGKNRYGTSKMTIAEQSAKGRVVVLDIEMEVCFSIPHRLF